MTRRTLLGAAASPILPLIGAAKRPNFVYLCSDQQHWQAMGFVDDFFDTPHSDALAAESVVFENAFCTTPQCSPSRSSMLTGFYPHHTRMMNNHGALGGTDLDFETIGPKLQRLGYRTAFFGKWHLGGDGRGNAGWDEEYKRGPDRETTRRGVEFLKRQATSGQPFALFLMYLDPHDIYHFKPGARDISGLETPMSGSWRRERFVDKPPVHKQFMTDNQGRVIWDEPDSEWRAYRDLYREKVRLYDSHVGEIVEAMKELGLWDDAVVVNTSDHGDMDTNHRLIFKGPFLYEHMVRIPMTVRLPMAYGGSGPRVERDYDWVNVDTAPTLLELAGGEAPVCHGQSVKALLTGQGSAPRRKFVIGQYYGKQTWLNPARMLRTHDWKYNLYIDHGEELYDLRNDPEELENLAGDPAHRNRKTELRSTLEEWMRAHDDPFHTLQTTPLDPREWEKIQTGRPAAG